MSKPIGVLFVASEAEPFIKSGSIGELAGSLPKIVKGMGHDIRVMVPSYGTINNRRFQIHELLRMRDIHIPVADGFERASVKSSYLNSENQKVLVYFLANDRYFSRAGLYFDPDTKKHFPDNDERFIFFCRGVLETLKHLHWQPQVIHCVDWQSGLIPAYLCSLYRSDPYFKNMKTVFTVCSLASHATFPKSSYEKTGLPAGLLNRNGSQAAERLSFLNAGLSFADTITTLGNKAEKGIWHSSETDAGKILQMRKKHIVPMGTDTHNGSCQETLAQKFVEMYRELAKNG